MTDRITKRVALAIYLCILILCTLSAWFARGVYDDIFLLAGHFHVVNATGQPLDLTLAFPSGNQHAFQIAPFASVDFMETNTGEGSIDIVIPGRSTDSVGYVTTMNQPIVLTIDQNHTTFSYISR